MLGVPIAIKDVEDIHGEPTRLGTRAFEGLADDDSPMVAHLRAAGAVFLGKTNLPELAICGFTESETWRRHAQPVGHGSHPQRLQRGQRRGDRRRAVRGRLGLGWGGLDPQPGGLLQPVRPEAADGADPVPARRALARALGHRVRHPDRARHCHLDRRDDDRRRRARRPAAARADLCRGRGNRAGQAARRALDQAGARGRAAGRHRRCEAGSRATRASYCAALGTRSARRTPPTGSPATTSPRGTWEASTTTSRRSHTPSAWRRAPAASAVSAALYPEAVLRVGRPRRREGRRPDQRPLRRLRRADHAGRRRGRLPGAPLGGQGGPADPAGHEPQLLLRAGSGTTRASRRRPSRWASPSEGLPRSVQIVVPPNREDVLISLAAQIEAEQPWADRRPPVS